MATAKFSGSAGYTLHATIGRSGSNVTVSAVTVEKAPNYSGQWTTNDYEWTITVSGGSGAKGTWDYDFRGNTGGKVTRQVTGAKSFARKAGSVKVTITVRSAFGTATITQTVTIPGVPPAPSSVKVKNATVTSLEYQFKLNGSGGSAITRVEVRWSKNKNMTGAVTDRLGAKVTSYVLSGAQPQTKYYFQSRVVNSYGNSPWSAVASGTTTAATAPTLQVTPLANGFSARISPTSPKGSTGISHYEVQRRVGTGPVQKTYIVRIRQDDGLPTGVIPPPIPGVPGPFPGSGISSENVAVDLTPGVTYQWRARAVYFAPYWGPWSDYISRTQPNPNTNPGDYYDGSYAAIDREVNFAWAGTAHGSASIVYGQKVRGWHALGDTGYDGWYALHLVRDGIVGERAARIIFRAAATIPGLHIGMNPGSANGRAAVIEETQYTGSILVEVSRAQVMVAEMVWLNAANAIISRSVSAPTVVQPDYLNRLSVTDFSPAGAVSASVRVVDVRASEEDDVSIEWSPWQSGDIITVDGAMVMLGELVDYFDGSTPDTPYFDYRWEGAENASISSRYPIDYEEDLLQDPECDPIPSAPKPPIIPTDCIVETGIWRRLSFQVNDGDVRLWSTSVPTFFIRTDDQAERQIRIRVHPNPDGLAPEELDTSFWSAEMIVNYLPANTLLTIDGVTQRAYAEVNGRDPRPADKLLVGSEGNPADWPELECGIGYLITLDVPTENEEDNLQVGMSLTQRI